MNVFLRGTLLPLCLALGCASIPAPRDPLEPATVRPEAKEFASRKAVLLASRVSLRLHPQFYGEIRYRIDGNFHTFREMGSPPESRMELRNVSTVQLQPVKLWVGEIEIAATDQIDVSFDAQALGVEFDAYGEVFWSSHGNTVHAERLVARDGELRFDGQR